jgi:septal ring factor EnvC (AmiA/AmiB activator)
MRSHLPLLFCVWLPLGGVLATSESPLSEARGTLEKWVQTRQLISRTHADWRSEKEMLEQTVALYERELQSLADQMSKVATNHTQVAREMAEAVASKQAAQEAIERTRAFAAEFEAKLKRVAVALPEPLRDAVQPLLARMPENAANTKMLAAERMQVIVGVLNELDKFNSSVAIYNQKRRNAKGEEVAVETVYVGLGAAYFVNEADTFAGTGAPGTNGWEWIEQPALAPSVRQVIKIYRSESAPAFVTLPASVR